MPDPANGHKAQRVLVLGATGMLGSMLVDALDRDPRFAVVATGRDEAACARLAARHRAIEVRRLDAASASPDDLAAIARGCGWAINAIGVIKQRIPGEAPDMVEAAIRANTLFPFVLARAAERVGMTAIQIATDCVFSGVSGGYDESTAHDPHDAYGKTKSLGEIRSKAVRHLRCSIIGPEVGQGVSLLSWFLGRPRGVTVDGYTNHIWNGITSLHFARLCMGVIAEDIALPDVQHVVPRGEIAKGDLLRLFARAFDRSDIAVRAVAADVAVNRTLTTLGPATNQRLWRAAGYERAPGFDEMIHELAAWMSAASRPRSVVDRKHVARGAVP